MGLDRRKRENAAFVLPFIGAAMIVPPVLTVFEADIRLFGIPAEIVYLFAVWMALVALTARLARRLGTAEPPARDAEGEAE